MLRNTENKTLDVNLFFLIHVMRVDGLIRERFLKFETGKQTEPLRIFQHLHVCCAESDLSGTTEGYEEV